MVVQMPLDRGQSGIKISHCLRTSEDVCYGIVFIYCCLESDPNLTILPSVTNIYVSLAVSSVTKYFRTDRTSRRRCIQQAT